MSGSEGASMARAGGIPAASQAQMVSRLRTAGKLMGALSALALVGAVLSMAVPGLRAGAGGRAFPYLVSATVGGALVTGLLFRQARGLERAIVAAPAGQAEQRLARARADLTRLTQERENLRAQPAGDSQAQGAAPSDDLRLLQERRQALTDQIAGIRAQADEAIALIHEEAAGADQRVNQQLTAATQELARQRGLLQAAQQQLREAQQAQERAPVPERPRLEAELASLNERVATLDAQLRERAARLPSLEELRTQLEESETELSIRENQRRFVDEYSQSAKKADRDVAKSSAERERTKYARELADLDAQVASAEREERGAVDYHLTSRQAGDARNRQELAEAQQKAQNAEAQRSWLTSERERLTAKIATLRGELQAAQAAQQRAEERLRPPAGAGAPGGVEPSAEDQAFWQLQNSLEVAIAREEAVGDAIRAAQKAIRALEGELVPLRASLEQNIRATDQVRAQHQILDEKVAQLRAQVQEQTAVRDRTLQRIQAYRDMERAAAVQPAPLPPAAPVEQAPPAYEPPAGAGVPVQAAVQAAPAPAAEEYDWITALRAVNLPRWHAEAREHLGEGEPADVRNAAQELLAAYQGKEPTDPTLLTEADGNRINAAYVRYDHALNQQRVEAAAPVPEEAVGAGRRDDAPGAGAAVARPEEAGLEAGERARLQNALALAQGMRASSNQQLRETAEAFIKVIGNPEDPDLGKRIAEVREAERLFDAAYMDAPSHQIPNMDRLGRLS